MQTFNSGVLTLSGKAANTASGARSSLARISNNRAAAYRASSKPYQRSSKNTWPDISPAKTAPVCFIFALIRE